MTKGLNNEQTEIRRWPYVKNMIYSYPSLCTLHQQALTQQITPTYSGLSGGSEGSRKTEADRGQSVYPDGGAGIRGGASGHPADPAAGQRSGTAANYPGDLLEAHPPSAARRWRRTSLIALPGAGTASSSGGWRKLWPAGLSWPPEPKWTA